MFLREDYHKVPSWSITEFAEDFQVLVWGCFVRNIKDALSMNISDIVQEEACLAGMTTVRRAVELSTTG